MVADADNIVADIIGWVILADDFADDFTVGSFIFWSLFFLLSILNMVIIQENFHYS